MSEDNNPATDGAQASHSKPVQKKSSSVRMLVLFGLLALVVAGVVYDYVFYPKKVGDTVASVNRLSAKSTPEEVQKAIGFAPQTLTDEENQCMVETYHFRRAIPFVKGRFMNVIYKDGYFSSLTVDKEYEPIVYNVPDQNLPEQGPMSMGGGAPPPSTDDEDGSEDADQSEEGGEEQGDEEGDEHADEHKEGEGAESGDDDTDHAEGEEHGEDDHEHAEGEGENEGDG